MECIKQLCDCFAYHEAFKTVFYCRLDRKNLPRNIYNDMECVLPKEIEHLKCMINSFENILGEVEYTNSLLKE